jgi:hypothetical protein
MMLFSDIALQPEVRELLELGGADAHLPPLVCGKPWNAEAAGRLRAATSRRLFPGADSPAGAMAGLWLYFSCFEECHAVAQELDTPEGSYWHAILHRQEPDDWNAGYWFRRVGRHAIFEPLAAEAARLAAQRPEAGWRTGGDWDPETFIRYCALGRQRPGSATERLARDIQSAEWRLLFSWCAHVRG